MVYLCIPVQEGDRTVGWLTEEKLPTVGRAVIKMLASCMTTAIHQITASNKLIQPILLLTDQKGLFPWCTMRQHTMRFESSAKALANCKLKYYRTSECSTVLHDQSADNPRLS